MSKTARGCQAFSFDAHVDDQKQSVFAILKADANYSFVNMPLTEVEMAIYKSNPDTFFDVVKPINRPLTKPLECFDFFAQTYMSAKRETLLEWMKDHPDIESLRTKSQKEVAEIYCDRMSASMWHRGQIAKEKSEVSFRVPQSGDSAVLSSADMADEPGSGTENVEAT